MTLEQFIAEWKKAELKERAAAQEHFLDLCRLLEHPRPAEAGHALDVARRNWLGDRSDRQRTLTALYNEKPTWLRDAHRRLHVAVFEAYGWDPDMTWEQLLEELLKLNLSSAAAAAATTP